jgi:O-antigen ligase
LLAFCALIIGAYSKIILIGILPLFFTVLWGWRKKTFAFQFQKEQWGWIILYLIYASYSLFYWDSHLSPRQIEYKLAWVIFPFIFSFRPSFKIQKHFVLYGLGCGIFIASLLGIIKASQLVIENGFSLSNISSSNICINHPTYFSAAVLLFLMMFILEWKDGGLKKWSRWLIITVIAFVLLMIVLSYSMASFLFLGLLGVIIWIYFFWSSTRSWKHIALFVGFPIILIAGISQVRAVQEEFSNTRQALNQYIENPTAFIQEKNQEQNGDEIRLIMWTASYQESAAHPMGVGPTQIGYHLSDRLVSFHQNKIAEKNAFGEVHYNPHNQFLQMALEVGIPTLLFFIVLIVQIFYYGIQTRGFILCGITLLLFFECLFESMLQRQTGIVTFTFFICYFVFLYNHSKTPSHPSPLKEDTL